MSVAPVEPEHGHVAFPGSILVAYVLFGIIAILTFSRTDLTAQIVGNWIGTHLIQFIGLILLPRFYAISLTQTYYFLRGEPVFSIWSMANRFLSERSVYWYGGILYLGVSIVISWGLLGFLFSWGNTP